MDVFKKLGKYSLIIQITILIIKNETLVRKSFKLSELLFKVLKKCKRIIAIKTIFCKLISIKVKI